MITVHHERFKDYLDELKILLPAHYEELALDKEHVPLDPQYGIYIDREERGELLLTTLRDKGEMVGYYIGFISPGLHYQTCLTCTMDIFYVGRDKCGPGGGMILFIEVENELRRRGVQRWYMGSKMHKDSSFLFEKVGAIPVEVYYSKWLGEE